MKYDDLFAECFTAIDDPIEFQLYQAFTQNRDGVLGEMGVSQRQYANFRLWKNFVEMDHMEIGSSYVTA